MSMTLYLSEGDTVNVQNLSIQHLRSHSSFTYSCIVGRTLRVMIFGSKLEELREEGGFHKYHTTFAFSFNSQMPVAVVINPVSRCDTEA